ncbi:MAG: hypothetical protein ACFB21_09345 [Opitutales bacterium]
MEPNRQIDLFGDEFSIAPAPNAEPSVVATTTPAMPSSVAITTEDADDEPSAPQLDAPRAHREETPEIDASDIGTNTPTPVRRIASEPRKEWLKIRVNASERRAILAQTPPGETFSGWARAALARKTTIDPSLESGGKKTTNDPSETTNDPF